MKNALTNEHCRRALNAVGGDEVFRNHNLLCIPDGGFLWSKGII